MQQLPGFADFTKSFPGVELFAQNLAQRQEARPSIAQYPQISAALGRRRHGVCSARPARRRR